MNNFRLLLLKKSEQKSESETEVGDTQLDTMKLSESERQRLEKKKKVCKQQGPVVQIGVSFTKMFEDLLSLTVCTKSTVLLFFFAEKL